ncbi:MAG: hypothetical protein ABJA74_16235 [Lapillicoccus sp.]
MTSTQQAPADHAELVWTAIESAGPDGVDTAAIAARTDLTRAQVTAAITVVLTMRRPVVDVDAALDRVGTRPPAARLRPGSPTDTQRPVGVPTHLVVGQQRAETANPVLT